MSFLQGIAGPSRCRLTTLTLTSTRNLTTSSSVRFARPTFIVLSPHPSKRPNRPIVAAPHHETPSVQSQIGRHGSTGVKSSWVRPKETLSYEKGYPDWEWVKEPVQPTDEYVEERRTIYARPPFQFYGRPHFIKYMWAIASLMVVMTILMPDTSDVAKVPDQLHIPPDVASDPKAVAQIVAGHEDSIRRRQFFNSILDSFTVVKFGIIVAIGGIVYIGSRQMTNCVTRLTQIRRVSLKPDVPVQYLIRVRTAIHEANIPMNPTHEDFTLKDTSVYYAGRQTGFLGLVAGGHSKYRMDLSPVDVDARDGEYVLSLNRLERIYGEIKMPTWDLNKRAPWAKLSDKVDAWAERR